MSSRQKAADMHDDVFGACSMNTMQFNQHCVMSQHPSAHCQRSHLPACLPLTPPQGSKT